MLHRSGCRRRWTSTRCLYNAWQVIVAHTITKHCKSFIFENFLSRIFYKICLPFICGFSIILFISIWAHAAHVFLSEGGGELIADTEYSAAARPTTAASRRPTQRRAAARALRYQRVPARQCARIPVGAVAGARSGRRCIPWRRPRGCRRPEFHRAAAATAVAQPVADAAFSTRNTAPERANARRPKRNPAARSSRRPSRLRQTRRRVRKPRRTEHIACRECHVVSAHGPHQPHRAGQGAVKHHKLNERANGGRLGHAQHTRPQQTQPCFYCHWWGAGFHRLPCVSGAAGC